MNLPDKEAIYEAWAPQGGRWSPWVKPVLFACMADETPSAEQTTSVAESWIPETSPMAVILDLPGADGIALGLQLAGRGWRPIPLYNAVPAPALGISAEAYAAFVDVHSIVSALRTGTARLRECSLAEDAPPAFLLDANRRGIQDFRTPDVGEFDNRSISFPTDFPSATRLLSHGIHRALLVQQSASQPQPDLAHTLRRWSEAGIELSWKRLGDNEPPSPLTVERPSRFRAFWHRLVSAAGLRPNALGGYGGAIDEPGSAG